MGEEEWGSGGENDELVRRVWLRWDSRIERRGGGKQRSGGGGHHETYSTTVDREKITSERAEE